ncbi:TetR/AcrR family transcriptional regulator [Aeromicrobium senzhongii]|uniref:TetR/AcrR family transcriptional regulator n=1 Tax=Aeromicrobium senzhongii TaxID=2663859 RepID=A0ABX6SUD5_9ACTN|nr:TetR/AcrR family transcriptional regulator [Aeromicrobium senzhongii]QNL94882.1 TetR/AcrR family transcriptional regulator [Aeromicrobium senzhongii]
MTQGWSVREDRDRADAERHRELVAAARSAFEELGYGATTIAEITRRAGVSRATFYVYFASKEQVFAVLAEQVRDRFVRAQDLSGVDRDDVEGVLRRTIATTLEATVENLALMTVLNHQAVADDAIRDLWLEIQREAVHRTAGYVRQQARAGRVSPVADPEALGYMGAGMNDRYAPLVVSGATTPEVAVEEMHRIWMACLGH